MYHAKLFFAWQINQIEILNWDELLWRHKIVQFFTLINQVSEWIVELCNIFEHKINFIFYCLQPSTVSVTIWQLRSNQRQGKFSKENISAQWTWKNERKWWFIRSLDFFMVKMKINWTIEFKQLCCWCRFLGDNGLPERKGDEKWKQKTQQNVKFSYFILMDSIHFREYFLFDSHQ